jgi:hypothetical protein
MRKVLLSVAIGLIGAIVGCVGGLIVAQGVPRCGEDCFAFVGGLVAGGGIAGALGFSAAIVGLNKTNWRRRALGLALLALALALSAAWMTSRHFSQMHDTQERTPPAPDRL